MNQLWQAALHDGRASSLVCPACTRPFTDFTEGLTAANGRIKVCVRCFWVWLTLEPLSSVAAIDAPPAIDERRVLGDEHADPGARPGAAEARRVLASLAAEELRCAL